MDHSPPVDLRWSKTKGWLRFYDPQRRCWDEVTCYDMPSWKRILVDRLRDEGRLHGRHEEPDADSSGERRFVCCAVEHEPCVFGLGLDCLNGSACSNPHHFGRGEP